MSDGSLGQESMPAVPRLMIMGVGSCGVRMIQELRAAYSDIECLAVDTDAKELQDTPPANTLQIGQSVTNGFSAGGDVELGRQSIEKDATALRTRLQHTDLLIVVGGLGGGTGSGAIPVVARIARASGTLLLCMVTLPFKFEGKSIIRRAEDSLKKIRTHADAIIRIPNEQMVGRREADLAVEEAFGRSRGVLLDCVDAIRQMLSENGVCGLDFACIQTMLRSCDGYFHYGRAEASGAKRCEQVCDELLTHPLLHEGKTLARCAGVLVWISGSPDIKVGEIEMLMDRVRERLPEETWVNFGVGIDPAMKKRLAAVLLVAEQWKEPLMDDARRQLGFTFNRQAREGQGELPLEPIGKGRFATVESTVLDGHDLDIPTYVRRGIKLPR